MDISSLLEVQVNEGQLTPNPDTAVARKKSIIQNKPSQSVSSDEALFFRQTFGDGIAQVRFRRLHCTSCDVHIGSAPCAAYNIQEHPVLKTLLCATCREFYGDGNFEQGDDATDMFCRWCANGGNLYCCSYCSNTFCDKCIKRNFTTEEQKKIEDDEKWKCFVCDPTDLYTHRAVCRALQQHVKTLAKILKADKNMSAKEIEQKMEQDDAKCCQNRRSRRKRRDSSSDDGNVSQRSRSPSRARSRPKKYKKIASDSADKSRVSVNGSRIFASGWHADITLKPGEDDDIPAPLLQCEQTMIEGDDQTVTPQGVILPANSSNSKIPDSILYNSAISLNPISPVGVIRTPATRTSKVVPIRPLRKVDSVPVGTTPQLIHRLPGKLPTSPMVTLPPRGSVINVNKRIITNRPLMSNYLKCKNNLTSEPSVIDLESDSEEPVVILPSPTSPKSVEPQVPKMQDQSTQCDESLVKSPARSRTRTIEDTINNPLAAIDDLLDTLRERLKLDLNQVRIYPEDNDTHNAYAKLKIVNRNVDLVVNELAAFNNRMVQQFNPWKTGESEKSSTGPIVLKKSEHSSKYGTLDLQCVNDSSSEVEEFDEDIEMEYLLDFSTKVKKFIVKDTVNQGTLATVETADKAIQAYEVITLDYDKAIGYSLLMKADYDYTRKKEIYKPAIIHDEYFGKYEEQFIFYLQNFEDHRKNLDMENSSFDEVSLTDLIDADIRPRTVVSPAKSTNSLDNYEERSLVICENGENNDNGEVSKNSEDKIVDNEDMPVVLNEREKSPDVSPMQTLSADTSTEAFNTTVSTCEDEKSSNNENNSEASPTKVEAMVVDENDECKSKHEETVIAVRALIEEESNDVDKWKNHEDEDECTILD